jgi:photosystem II stability/assembly factor-like uncharacterized protein
LSHFCAKKSWTLLIACTLTLSLAGGSSRGAVEGNVMRRVPPWLSLFAAAIRPNGSIYLVGSKARLLFSKDHGATWTERTLQERKGGPLFQDRDLYSIRFDAGGGSGWIAGEDGIIFHTADGGATWTRQNSGVTTNLFKLAVVNASTAVAVGAYGTLLRTSDGGTHWQTVKSPRSVDWFDVTFTSSNVGWTVGELSTIARTDDGGQSWTIKYAAKGGTFEVGPLFSISFADPQHGTAAGLSGDLMTTSDGGNSWLPQQLPESVASYVVADDPVTGQVWAAGAGGRMFARSADGQWREAPRSAFRDITDLAFAGNAGVAVGLSGTILLTTNAGEQWRVVH